MRERLEASRSDRDLKRGFGGIVDVEFLVQLFQLKYGRRLPALRTTNTWEALDALHGQACSRSRRTRRAARRLTISCAWWRAGCASSTIARWTSCRQPR